MRVKIGIIGLGRVSRSHIDAISHWPDLCELAAVVDLQEDLARAYSEEFSVPYYTTVKGMLENENIDAVIICLPHHLHMEVTMEVCNAKKHVLVEKVMATNVDEGMKMVKAARENEVNLMVGQSRRFFKSSLEAKKRIGEIGKVSNLLYVLACHFDSTSAPKWWKSKKATGGLVYPMQGAHSIDFTLWLMEDRRPVSVFAKGTSTNSVFEGDDEVSIIITFDDGSQATNLLSINSRILMHDCLILGANGTMKFRQGVGNTDLVGVEGTELFINDEKVMEGASHPHNFALQMKEFVESIKENRTPIASGEEVLNQLKVIEAAQQSAQSESIVYI